MLSFREQKSASGATAVVESVLFGVQLFGYKRKSVLSFQFVHDKWFFVCSFTDTYNYIWYTTRNMFSFNVNWIICHHIILSSVDDCSHSHTCKKIVWAAHAIFYCFYVYIFRLGWYWLLIASLFSGRFLCNFNKHGKVHPVYTFKNLANRNITIHCMQCTQWTKLMTIHLLFI